MFGEADYVVVDAFCSFWLLEGSQNVCLQEARLY
jgi:hypothetical protein